MPDGENPEYDYRVTLRLKNTLSATLEERQREGAPAAEPLETVPA